MLFRADWDAYRAFVSERQEEQVPSKRRAGRMVTGGALATAFLLAGATTAMAATGTGAGSSVPAGGAGTGAGTAGTTISLASLSLGNSTTSASLGTLQATATSVSNLVSTLSLQGTQVLGQEAPGTTISSTGGSKSGNANVSVPAASGFSGTLTLANYLVDATGGKATADLGALTGGITGGPLGLSAALGQHGLGSVVDPTSATSGVDLSSPGFSLTLGDLLPANVLDALPLGTVLSLVQGLHLPLPADVANQVSQLTAQIPAVGTAAGQLTGQLAQLQAAQTALMSTAAQLAPANPAVKGALGTVNGITGTLSSLPSLSSAAATPILSQLGTALTGLAQADPTGQLAAALAKVQSLTAGVQPLLDQLTGAISGLPNLSNLLNSLLGDLHGAPLVSLGQLGLSLASAANAQAGQATLSCTLGSLSVLGTSLLGGSAPLGSVTGAVGSVTSALPTGSLLGGPPTSASPSGSCRAVTSTFSTVQSLLTAALGKLPVAAPLSDVVSVSGLQPTTSATSHPDANHTTSATAGITPLQLAINPLALTNVADPLLGQLTGPLDQLLGALGAPALPGLPTSGLASSGLPSAGTASAASGLGSTVSGAVSGVTGAVSGATGTVSGAAGGVTSGLPSALRADSVTASGLPVVGTLPSLLGSLDPAGLSSLTSALGPLASQLTALPTGGALAGLSTLGVKASLLGVSTKSAFTTAEAPASPALVPPQTPSFPAASPTPASATPASATPAPSSSLPFTGADVTGLAAVGMLILALGTHLIAGTRRTRVVVPGSSSSPRR